jgi:hypothetical protein
MRVWQSDPHLAPKRYEATFSDVLAFFRRAIWAEKYFVSSIHGSDRLELSRSEMEVLLDRFTAAAFWLDVLLVET